MIDWSSGMARVSLIALLFATAAEAAPALPPPSPSPPEFVQRPFGPTPPPTPPRPSVVRIGTPTPLPRKWIIGAGVFGALTGGALLFFGIRAWQTSRLFGRQYRFPVRENVALRLGGERSGGCQATTRFGNRDSRLGAPSKPKDT